MKSSETSEPLEVIKAQKIRCLHSNCWGAKCPRCGKWLTKHAFTPNDALDEARFEIIRTDGKRHGCF